MDLGVAGGAALQAVSELLIFQTKFRKYTTGSYKKKSVGGNSSRVKLPLSSVTACLCNQCQICGELYTQYDIFYTWYILYYSVLYYYPVYYTIVLLYYYTSYLLWISIQIIHINKLGLSWAFLHKIHLGSGVKGLIQTYLRFAETSIDTTLDIVQSSNDFGSRNKVRAEKSSNRRKSQTFFLSNFFPLKFFEFIWI